ncbi:MAG: DUF922 domain-containing protein [Candidatus Limnocylindrales bacterium]
MEALPACGDRVYTVAIRMGLVATALTCSLVLLASAASSVASLGPAISPSPTPSALATPPTPPVAPLAETHAIDDPPEPTPVEPTPEPVEFVSQAPVFAGPATLRLSGVRGTYTWQDVNFGADRVQTRATLTGGQSPCSLDLHFGTGEERITSKRFEAEADATQTRKSELRVGYVSTALQATSTCDPWSLRIKPLGDPGLKFSITERYYTIEGDTASGLRAAMEAAGPGDHWAHTKWRLDWRFRWVERGTSCRVTRGSARVVAVIRYPRWPGESDAEPRLNERWRRFLEALRTHELGHLTIALQGAAAIDERLDKGVVAPTCRRVGSKANAIAKRLLERARDREVKYDEVTDHGITQGTRFP